MPWNHVDVQSREEVDRDQKIQGVPRGCVADKSLPWIGSPKHRVAMLLTRSLNLEARSATARHRHFGVARHRLRHRLVQKGVLGSGQLHPDIDTTKRNSSMIRIYNGIAFGIDSPLYSYLAAGISLF